MNRKPNRRILGALTLAVLLGVPFANAQMAQTEGAHTMKHEMMHGQQDRGDMPAKCKAMMQKKQQMMEKCKMMDAKLDQLVAAMNAASGQQKVEAMAAVLNELVAQRKAMHQMMMKMQEGEMSGMMGGMSKDAKHKCKMMQQKMMAKQGQASASSGAGGDTK